MIVKKLICFVIGHKVIDKSCPVTNATKTYCVRCDVSNKHSKMSFQ
mgnify:CR=1 FL=1